MTREKLTESVERILWEVWDPIGVNDCDDARGEYDSYALSVTTLLLNGADAKTISDHLHNHEIVSIGLNGNLARCEATARVLISALDANAMN